MVLFLLYMAKRRDVLKMASYREELVANLAGKLFAENLLNTKDFYETDSLIDAVSSVIRSAMIDLVIIKGEVLE